MPQLPDSLKKCINNKAEALAAVNFEHETLTRQQAIERLTNWCLNFKHFLPNLEVLNKIIEKIEVITDTRIRDRVIKELKRKPDIDYKEFFYCPLGSKNESSARIISSLNDLPRHFNSIESCLEKILKDNIPDPTIVFIDDFINSGGQFNSILNKWFDHNNLNHSIDRKSLPKKLQEVIKNTNLRFYFFKGMETGRQKANEVIAKYNLKADLSVVEQYDDLSGIFGSKSTIEEIRSGNENLCPDDSIFKGFSCAEVKPLLEICESAGRSFLKYRKPDWSKEKLENRILGYGNSAQLFITENNVPTSTLTCLWAYGTLKIKEKTFNWQPLLKRREKNVGNESSFRNINIKRDQNKQTLDFGFDPITGKDSPAELMFLIQIPASSFKTFKFTDDWKDSSKSFLDSLHPNSKISTDTQNALANKKIYCYQKNLFEYFKNRPVFDGLKSNFKITQAKAFLCFLNNYYFSALKFKLDTGDTTFKDFIELANKMSQTRQAAKGSIKITTKQQSFTLPQLFEQVFNLAPETITLYTRFKIFLFARLAKNEAIPNFSLEEISKSLKNFKPVYPSNHRSIDEELKTVHLDFDALMTLSDSGSGCICTSKYACNDSYTQERFMNKYLFLYLWPYSLSLPELKPANENFIIKFKPEMIERNKEKQYFMQAIKLFGVSPL